MFRAAAVGPFDDAIAKATDENLTSEDWGAIMEVCDKATGDPTGPKEAVQSMIKRLAHRNANVQLYTLELAHALCQNCGKPMHREVSSRAFTDALLKLANDRNTHQQVKAKILEKMKDWSDMFSKDAELGIMYDAYYRLKQTNPTLQAPSAPQKQGLTASDRQKEDDELQMALKLSLQEEDRKKTVASSSPAQPGSSGKEDAAPAPPLEFKKGDVIAVLESVYKDWWRGSLKGNTGIFPLNYVEKLTDPTPDELQREAQMEAEVFAEIKNVEKLLTLLSASNTGPREEDNEEISKLYHQTLAIRPKLIKLIEKYSQKKDDFTQLNEKFIKARRDYESLLESSMAHPPQHNYQQYAMRLGQGYPQAGGYPSQPPPSQEPNQYYNSASPQGMDHGYQASSPPPSFPPGGQLGNAPFYVGGAEVPSHAGNQPPPPQQYPPRDSTPRIPSSSQPSVPNKNTSPPPQVQSYTPYSPQPQQMYHPPSQQAQQQPAPLQPLQRPQSTYGAQELATSVYDSPIAPHNPNSFYPQDEAASNAPHTASSPPFHQQQAPSQPHYQSYAPPDQAPPPVPTAQPPQVPGSSGAPSGGAPQYKPYVPPGASAPDGPSAPSPNDYYRQPGGY
ncbi:hypothetical protein LLEC1_01784 [Akanthomyces lecanii]|uniref:Class E vacuolar protein-sorting machinery protein HSE1 n=1 Tax=Cordyceps confragosa TaxID=2714763 RepID=A0A179I1V8_CORDF|nr:hypothetical protein LLEC1_01784 [Akanthomyces lecanii]